MTHATERDLQKLFRDLQAQKSEIIENTGSIRARYEAGRRRVSRAQESLSETRAELIAARAPLAEIDRQIAEVTRTLRGRTGPVT